jgi:DNA gyrase subunit A
MTEKKPAVSDISPADDQNIEEAVRPTEIATPHGLILAQPIVDEMRQSYLDYAMSVIVSRALPDVRDGLKPVHRRILYAMWSLGLRSGGKFRKSATVVGEVLGKYHPHGDSAVYDSMARMAQDFAMRYMMVRGQGNFGSVDGDRPAAMRYTEAKLSAIAEEMLFDLDKDTVNMIANFDGSQNEPQVLPAKIPQLLLNGCMGIAVGMATNIPPHNLREIISAILKLIDNPEATIEELMEFIKGPDFPTGGLIYNREDILRAYTTGKGGIVMRGRAEIVENGHDSFQIVISEIPYQVNKATLVEKIADLVKDKKIEGIRDLRDESDKDGIRIVIDLKRDSYPKKILNVLYKQTQLQETFHVNMLALVDGLQPRVLNLKTILEEFIKHRQEVVRRRTAYELAKAKDRAHILEGLMIALAHIDEVIATIKASKDKDKAKANLIKRFKLSDRQAVAILEMKLQTLANLETLKIETELKDKLKTIAELENILSSDSLVLKIIKQECQDVVEKFGDDRRTGVVDQSVKNFKVEDLIPNEEAVVIMTRDGYIKRLPGDAFKVQGRGGKGVIGLTTKEEDSVQFLFTTMTHSDLLFFTSHGRVFELKAYELPLASRTSKGQAIVNFLQLANSEQVTAILPLDKMANKEYLFFATRRGLVKKVRINAFDNVRRSGLIAIKLKENDQLIWVKPTTGNDQIQMVTAHGQAIRFHEEDVRDMGRGASGVIGMRLKTKDQIIGMGVIKADSERLKDYQVLSVMANGYGKRTSLSQYKVQNRGGSGIKTAKITDKTGELVNAFLVNKKTMEDKDLIIMSKQGQVIRLPFKTVNESGRDTQGVCLMRFKENNDQVVGVTWL